MNDPFPPTMVNRRIRCNRGQFDLYLSFRAARLQPGTHFARCHK